MQVCTNIKCAFVCMLASCYDEDNSALVGSLLEDI